MNLVTQLLNFASSFSTRAGLEGFVERYGPVAAKVVQDLAGVRNNQDFSAWKDTAFREVKDVTGEVKDTWVSIVVASAAHLLGEGTKPRNWIVNLFSKAFGFLNKRAPSLTELLRKYGEPAVHIVNRLVATTNNSQFKDIERDAVANLRSLYAELGSAAAGLVVNAVFEALKSKQDSV